ncbi:MAG: glycosyltransferase [Gemmatimonadaceae bacterium]|nr:glycosyltransferase [Gemmatimonadaceae bacterium]
MIALALLQTLLAALLAWRLMGGRRRRPAETPRADGADLPPLTIVVATLNESARIGPCLRGLQAQGAPVREILVVDSGSTDGTRELVLAAADSDPRIQLLTDPPLPADWIGKAWALQFATEQASSPWVLGMDADTEALPGCAAAVLAAAQRDGFDVVSFAARFDGQTAAERWLQPALLITLLYRGGAPGDARVRPDRVMANGQCFLARREVLLAQGGYVPVRQSFAEDVSLVRHLARRGVSVGFLDGSRLYLVRSYTGLRQMWREWGRSLDLKDATTKLRQAGDTAFVVLAQGAQLPLAVWLAGAWPTLPAGGWRSTIAAATAFLVGVRWLLLLAIAPSYARRGPSWWLSPLADPIAALRLVMSSLRRPRQWRTRSYVTPASPHPPT